MIRHSLVVAATLFFATVAVAQQTSRFFLDTVGASESASRPATPLSYTNQIVQGTSRFYIYIAYGQANQKAATIRIGAQVDGPAVITGWSIYNHVLPGNATPRWSSVNQGSLDVTGKILTGVEMLGVGVPPGASNIPAATAADTAHFRASAGANDPFGTTLLGYIDVRHAGGEGTAALRLNLPAATGAVFYTLGAPGSDTVAFGWNDTALTANASGSVSATADGVVAPAPVRPPVAVFSDFAALGSSLVPGGAAGERFESFSRPFPSPDGARIIFGANTDAATSGDGIILLGALLPKPRLAIGVREGTPTFFDGAVNYGILDEYCAINNTGQWAFSGDTSATTTTDEIVARWDGAAFGLVAREGTQAIGQGPGIGYGSLADTVHLTTTGQVRFRSATLTGATTQQVIYQATDPASGLVLFQTDSVLPSLQLTPPAQSIDNFTANRFSSDPQSGNIIVAGDLNGPTTTDAFVMVNGTIRGQEGSVLPGSSFASPVASFGFERMAVGGGSWLFRGSNADGRDWVSRGVSLASNTVVANSGAPITPESTELFDDSAFSPTFFTIAPDRLGHYVIGGTTNSPDTQANAVLTLDGRIVISREGDGVDLDGNGTADSAFISTYNNDDCFLTDDGRFYFTADLRNGVGVSIGQALLRLDTPDVLFDNGPIVTQQGVGGNGSDVNREDDAPGGGVGTNNSGTFRIADDFVVPANTEWIVDSITILAYGFSTPAGDPPVSPFTGLTLRIWDGPPGAVGSNIVFGDTTTNRLVTSGFAGTYRIPAGTALTSTARAIMYLVVDLDGIVLPAGDYWIDYATTHSVGSAFSPPVIYHRLGGKSGANGQQSANSGSTYAPTAAPARDFPFTVRGQSRTVNIDESEPNNSKPTATPATLTLNDSATITGTATGGDVDYYLITTPKVLGIWEHTLTLTTTIGGHTLSLRGDLQSAGVITTSSDIPLQTAISSGSSRTLRWYSLPGDPAPAVYVSVSGTAGTTAPYSLTLSSVPITPTDIPGGPFRGPTIQFTSVGSVDSECWVYDGSLSPIVGYGNDDKINTLSRLQRTFAPGTYYIAWARFNFANNQESPPDDNFRNGGVLDFPNVAQSSSQSFAGNLNFTTGTANELRNTPLVSSIPFQVHWMRFTVLPSLACSAADIATSGSADPLSGPDGFLTGEDFDVFIQAFFSELRNNAGVLIADLTDDSGTGPPDGFLTGADFDRFILLFFTGC